MCCVYSKNNHDVMNANDLLGVVTQNNWLFLSTTKQFIKLFLLKRH